MGRAEACENVVNEQDFREISAQFFFFQVPYAGIPTVFDQLTFKRTFTLVAA